jgi:hypothetical protein
MQLRHIDSCAQQEGDVCLRRREGSKMSDDDSGRDKPTNGRRGRRPSKGLHQARWLGQSRRSAHEWPVVRFERLPLSSRNPSPPAEAGRAAALETHKKDEQVPMPGPEGAGAGVEVGGIHTGEPEVHVPVKNIPKRGSPASKAKAAKPQASSEAQDTPHGRSEAGAQRGATRQRAGGRRKRVDPRSQAAPGVDPVNPTSPEPSDQPTADPMADLAGLDEQSLHESLQSLRSVTESRTLSELLERQSRHMRLMTEIWMRQAQRSMEVFNAMLSHRRK